MNNLEWFTGNEMSAAEVAAMTLDEIKVGIANIGVTEDTDVDTLAREIKALAEAELD
jgi:hypothetical protein